MAGESSGSGGSERTNFESFGLLEILSKLFFDVLIVPGRATAGILPLRSNPKVRLPFVYRVF